MSNTVIRTMTLRKPQFWTIVSKERRPARKYWKKVKCLKSQKRIPLQLGQKNKGSPLFSTPAASRLPSAKEVRLGLSTHVQVIGVDVGKLKVKREREVQETVKKWCNQARQIIGVKNVIDTTVVEASFIACTRKVQNVQRQVKPISRRTKILLK